MSIDQPASGPDDSRDAYRRCRETARQLEKMGFKILDQRVVHETHPLEFHDMYAYQYKEENYRRNFSYQIEVNMSERTAEDLIRLVEHSEYLEKRSREYEQRFQLSQTDLIALRKRLDNLEQVLDENPGIRDQWDEIMTMLKLAGYHDDLF